MDLCSRTALKLILMHKLCSSKELKELLQLCYICSCDFCYCSVRIVALLEWLVDGMCICHGIYCLHGFCNCIYFILRVPSLALNLGCGSSGAVESYNLFGLDFFSSLLAMVPGVCSLFGFSINYSCCRSELREWLAFQRLRVQARYTSRQDVYIKWMPASTIRYL